jgi:hypothetical protein
MPSGHRTGHAGQCKQWPQLSEYCNHKRHGFMGMTQKRRWSRHSGNIWHPRGQKKHGRSAARSCLPFSFIPVEWCIMSMNHKAKPSQKSTTKRSFATSVILCNSNDRICGQQNLGSSITTTYQPILRM